MKVNLCSWQCSIPLALGLSFGWGLAVSQELRGVVTLDPASVPAAASYAHGKLVSEQAKLLITAGQIGRNADGELGQDIEQQAEYAMRNLRAVVEEAGMGPEDVLKLTMFYLRVEDIRPIMEARQRVFGEDFRPASTALVVQSLASPNLLVEVDAIAARL